MDLIEIGRVCIKTKGRDAGSIVAIVDVDDNNTPIIEGKNARRRKCNAKHLFFTDRKISIKKNAPKEEVVRKLEEESR